MGDRALGVVTRDVDVVLVWFISDEIPLLLEGVYGDDGAVTAAGVRT